MVARVASLSGERMARMSPRDSMGVVVCYSLGWGVTGSVWCAVLQCRAGVSSHKDGMEQRIWDRIRIAAWRKVII